MNNPSSRPPSFPASSAPAFLRGALVAARRDVPDQASIARLAGKLPLDVPPPRGGGGPSGAPPPMPPIPSILPGVIVGAGLGAIVSAIGLFWDARSTPQPAPIVHAETTTTADTAMRAPDSPPTRVAPTAVPIAVAKPSAPDDSSRAVPAPSSSADRASPSDSPSDGIGVGAPPSGISESEAQLLQRAHDALQSGPARALELTREHAARFPSGVLAQEREVVAIEALVQLGRADEARTRAASFIQAYPGSAHRRRIEALVAR